MHYDLNGFVISFMGNPYLLKTESMEIFLLMEKEDMDYLPIFTREGASWGKLNKVFDDDLETIIHDINMAIAA